jgi:HSP20 family protein
MGVHRARCFRGEDIMYHPLFSRDLFADVARLQREAEQTLERVASIRGNRQAYPALNIGTTPEAVEIYAFAPGLEPGSLDVQLEKGVLAISGERMPPTADEAVRLTRHLDERFSGRFRRVVSLPDDVDPEAVSARYRDGVLHISLPRRESAQARRITVQ